MRDQGEVCPLSRGVMLQPLSIRLPVGLRFFPHPVPAPPWASLAACCPRRERYGVSTFRLQKHVGLGTCYRPGSMWVTTAHSEHASPASITFWFKRKSHFRLFLVTTFNAGSHMFAMPTISHYSDYGCQKGMSLTIYTPHLAVLRYFVGAALDSGILDSPGDTDGPLLKWRQLLQATSCRTQTHRFAR
jgi:hypothetical protein